MILAILSLICNSAVFLMTFISLLVFFIRGGDANMKVKKSGCFVFFTVDSNILAAVVSLIMAVFNVNTLVTGVNSVPVWATVLKYVGAAAVALTFFVVVIVLAPTSPDGYWSLFEKSGLLMHLLSPVLAMVSFILLDGGEPLSYLNILFALMPTLIYAVVYFTMVIIVGEEKGGWRDFYGFNRGGKWYFIAPCIIGMSALISFLLLLLRSLTF